MKLPVRLTVRASSASLMVGSPPAEVAKPRTISLTFTMHFTSAATTTGTWTATSAPAVLNGGSGQVVLPTTISDKGKKRDRSYEGRKVVAATDGTFVIQFNGAVRAAGAATSEVTGRFVLKKGTGAYAGLHGTGKIHATLDSASGAITAVYTGKAHIGGGS